MPRIIPLRGTDAQRQTAQTAGKILTGEIHTTTDQKRLFFEGTVVAPYYHGTVADEAAMLALSSSTRGCWMGDSCKRTDTGFIYTCITSNGTSAGHWQASLPAGASVPGSFTTLISSVSATFNNTGAASVVTIKRTDGGATCEIKSRGDQMHIGTSDNFPLNFYVNAVQVAVINSTGFQGPLGASTPNTVAATALTSNSIVVTGGAGTNLVSYFTSPASFGSFLEFGPSSAYVEMSGSSAGDFSLSHNGVVAGVMRSVRSGAVADTLVLQAGVVSTKALVCTVADSVRGFKVAGATGKLRFMGYDGGRAYIDAINAAESSNIPLSLNASEYAINTSTLEVSITNTGVSIGTPTPYSRLHVEKSKSNTISESTAAARIGANDVYLFTGTLNGTPNYGAWIQTLNTSNTPFPLLLNPNGSPVAIGGSSTGSSQLAIHGLPTNSSGLSSGDVWNDSGTLKIV